MADHTFLTSQGYTVVESGSNWPQSGMTVGNIYWRNSDRSYLIATSATEGEPLLQANGRVYSPMDAAAVVGGSSGLYEGQAIMYKQAASAASRPMSSPTFTKSAGAGVEIETFVISGTTYYGFGVTGAGNYIVSVFQGGQQSSTAAAGRHASAFPTTTGTITTAGTAISIDPSSVNAEHRTGLALTATSQKIWLYPTGSETHLGFELFKVD